MAIQSIAMMALPFVQAGIDILIIVAKLLRTVAQTVF